MSRLRSPSLLPLHLDAAAFPARSRGNSHSATAPARHDAAHERCGRRDAPPHSCASLSLQHAERSNRLCGCTVPTTKRPPARGFPRCCRCEEREKEAVARSGCDPK
ncbi:hypothetical protein FA09DRAFT_331107, partial [Tilletiopsis washingtonensis]